MNTQRINNNVHTFTIPLIRKCGAFSFKGAASQIANPWIPRARVFATCIQFTFGPFWISLDK